GGPRGASARPSRRALRADALPRAPPRIRRLKEAALPRPGPRRWRRPPRRERAGERRLDAGQEAGEGLGLGPGEIGEQRAEPVAQQGLGRAEGARSGGRERERLAPP